MNYWGKIIGGLFGFSIGGPFGLLLGILGGHFYDLHMHNTVRQGRKSGAGVFAAFDQVRAQQAFFRATFLIMGYVAKADGRVTESEIQRAEAIMSQMGLTQALRRQAINFFNQGKQAEFDPEQSLNLLQTACGRHRNLLRMFIEIQFQVAYADRKVGPKLASILEQLCARLGFTAAEYEDFNNRYKGERAYQRRAPSQDPRRGLDDAYQVLGMTKNASDAEIKKSYRRLMAQHHPDKLVAKGLPEEMMKMATEKTQEIKAAYEQIRTARGMKR